MQSPDARRDFDAECLEAFAAYMATSPRSKAQAARDLGLLPGTFNNRLKKYHARDLGKALPVEVNHGLELREHTHQFDKDGNLTAQSIKLGAESSDEPFEVPTGHRVKGVSAYTDANGNVRGMWTKTVEGERSDHEIAEAARIAAERYVSPAAPFILSPSVIEQADAGLLTLHTLPDLHIGLKSHLANAQMDWDLPTAITTYKRLMRLLVERSPRSAVGVILGGGDLLHYDDDQKRTRQSGHSLDGDDPYPVVLAETELLLVYQTELALQKYPLVVVRILAGNHDPDSAVAVSHFLKAWFRNEPRVVVDTDPSLFWFYQFGDVMLAATHGHEAKISQMPGIMAADRRDMWGSSKHCYAHGFHIHHATRSNGEESGCKWETHETPVPRDTYHQQKGYRSARSLGTVTYHSRRGESGRSLETLL